MYMLHARRGAGSAAVEALLAVLALPHRIELVPREADGRIPPSFYEVNPLGEVPTLILPDGQIMTESAAIIIHLADRHGDYRYAPAPDSPLRPGYLRWMIFLATNCYMTDLRFMYPERYTTDQAGAEAVKQAAVARWDDEWRILADALGEAPFILGGTVSALDIYAAMLATWSLDLPAFFKRFPNVERHYRRVAAIPAIADVWARNEMPV